MEAAVRYFSAVKTFVLDLLFPKLCLGCGAEGVSFCEACRSRMARPAPSCPICSKRNFTGILCTSCAEKSGLRRFLAPFSYRDPLVRELIHTYKYAGVRGLAALFADEIAAFLEAYGIRPNKTFMLVPIPLHRSRERERGFNQAELLARELGERLELPLGELLARRRATESQIDMESYQKRRENVADAFRVTDPAAVKDKSIILVDDVSTSGATFSEAARVLRGAGARTVWAIVVAKG
jgi:ComF family protein